MVRIYRIDLGMSNFSIRFFQCYRSAGWGLACIKTIYFSNCIHLIGELRILKACLILESIYGCILRF